MDAKLDTELNAKSDAKSRATHIKLVAFDIDGVMTDGGLHYTDDGGELKTFNVQDGLGLLEKLGLEWPECAFMGDDAIDLPAMSKCGLAIAPANARPIVKQHAHLITDASGGQGAVREAIEFILAAQDKLDAAFAPYLMPQ